MCVFIISAGYAIKLGERLNSQIQDHSGTEQVARSVCVCIDVLMYSI